jgi:hypothetical protein
MPVLIIFFALPTDPNPENDARTHPTDGLTGQEQQYAGDLHGYATAGKNVVPPAHECTAPGE